jgi:hypothetical protein
MPSQVWGRDPEEAYANPYEYDLQEQFVREATTLLDKLYSELNKYSLKFHRDDTSLQKATWIIQLDAVDAARDCLSMLESHKHRLAGRLFRDIIESLDLVAYFSSGSEAASKDLKKWYQDEFIPHRMYRDFLREQQGLEAWEERRNLYHDLSKFTHGSYRVLLKSYSLGGDDLLVYDGYARDCHLVLPHTMAYYYAILANLIEFVVTQLSTRGLLGEMVVNKAWEESLEKETVKRRFLPHSPGYWAQVQR